MLIYFFEKNSIFLHIQICIGSENINLSPFKLLVFGPETVLARNSGQYKISKILDKSAARK